MMPMYEFVRCDDGERVEKFFPMQSAPALDAIVDVDGHACRRVASVAGGSVPFRPFASVSAPRWDPLAPNHDNKGRPLFNNEADLKRYERAQLDSDRDKVFLSDATTSPMT